MCARQYDLACIISMLMMNGEFASEEIRERGIAWSHKAFELFLYVYRESGLSQHWGHLEVSKRNFFACVRFRIAEEFETYRKLYDQWFEILRMKLHEEISVARYREYYDIVELVAACLMKSDFPGHADIAFGVVVEQGRLGLKAAITKEQKDVFRAGFSIFSDRTTETIRNADREIREESVKSVLELFHDIYDEEGKEGEESVENVDSIYRLTNLYSAIGDYYLRNDSLKHHSIRALMWLEKSILKGEGLRTVSEHVQYLILLAKVYHTAGMTVRRLDKSNPLWNTYLNAAMEICGEVGKRDPKKIDTVMMGEIRDLLRDRISNHILESSVHRVTDAYRKAPDKEALLRELLEFMVRSEVFVLVTRNSPDDHSCLSVRVNGKVRMVAVSYALIQKMVIQDPVFEGIQLNVSPNDIFLPVTCLADKEESNEKRNHKVSRIRMDKKILMELKNKTRYQQLIPVDEEISAVEDAIRSHAGDVAIESVLAVDETGRRGWLKKKSEGVLFTEEFVCSSHFPDHRRKILYDEISSVTQHADEVKITLKNGQFVLANFEGSNSNVMDLLRAVLELGD